MPGEPSVLRAGGPGPIRSGPTVTDATTDTTKTHAKNDDEQSPTVNTRPGPTDEGGHGGMATREQEARLEGQ